MTVNISTMPPQIQQRYNDKLLSTPEKNLIFNLFATPVELPDNQGFIDRQSRYDRLDLFPVPLDDAQNNPPAQQLNRVDVDCRVRIYATYIVLTRQVTITNEDPVLNSAAARLGQAGRETQDVLQRDNLESSASIINSVGGDNGDLPTEMTPEDVSDVVTLLQNNSGEYITNMIPGQLKIGTSPIGDSYGALCPTQMIPVFNNMTGFTRKFAYPNVSETLSTEWGGINNVRFFVSDQGSITPNASLAGNDVANNFVCAKEAYKVVWQAGGKMKFVYLPPGYLNDPAMLRHSAACVFYQGQCITNDLWIMNLRSTMTLA
ncbi:MAG TPA: N4-gp56 family major capsid protein [Candidatus Nitrosotenuis sp.]|nr:N4-gp56 family major capsid protein [Candidatus Nitrosotenuis sp.]